MAVTPEVSQAAALRSHPSQPKTAGSLKGTGVIWSAMKSPGTDSNRNRVAKAA